MKHNKQKRSAPSQRLKMHILGSAGDVSGSLFFFEYTDASKKITRFLLECGLHQEHESINHEKRLPKGVTASDINFVIISHAHIDHSGWLPALVKDGFAGAVYTHPATKDLLQFLLADSGRLQEMAAARSNKRITAQQQALALAPKANTKSGAKSGVKSAAKNTKVLPLVEPLYRAEDAANCTASNLRRSQRMSGCRRTMPDAVHGTSARMRSNGWLSHQPDLPASPTLTLADSLSLVKFS